MLNSYENFVRDNWSYKGSDHVAYCAVALGGEAGEVLNEVKKSMRSGENRMPQVCDELGDTLHYLTRLGQLHGYSLEDIMDFNMTKLTLRKVKTSA